MSGKVYKDKLFSLYITQDIYTLFCTWIMGYSTEQYK